jgi:hypothetical protein
MIITRGSFTIIEGDKVNTGWRHKEALGGIVEATSQQLSLQISAASLCEARLRDGKQRKMELEWQV